MGHFTTCVLDLVKVFDGFALNCFLDDNSFALFFFTLLQLIYHFLNHISSQEILQKVAKRTTCNTWTYIDDRAENGLDHKTNFQSGEQ